MRTGEPEPRAPSRSDGTQRLLIACTFTAEPIRDVLEYWSTHLDLGWKIAFSGYNQVFQNLLRDEVVDANTAKGAHVILLRLSDWAGDPRQNADSSSRRGSVRRCCTDFVEAMSAALARTPAHRLVVLCPSVPSEIQLGETERQFALRLRALERVRVITAAEVMSRYPVTELFDKEGDILGAIPYSLEFYTAVGTTVARELSATRHPPPKVLVIDGDNTLWRGIVGEEGADGVTLDEPSRALQEFMRDQRQAGRLLCLCSKNEEADVRQVFSRHPEFPLKFDDFLACRLNWRPKSENIRSLAEELNLGTDGFAFFDDNPAECAEVSAHCPGVSVFEIPSPDGDVRRFLAHAWPLDIRTVTAEDQRRTALYVSERERASLRRTAGTYHEFLANLGLTVECAPMQVEEQERVGQLLQRTNQFNFTTPRWTVVELQGLLAGGHEVWVARVRDRFGDYGRVGVLIFRKHEKELVVSAFLLSCRVLGRGVEHDLVVRLGALAEARGCETLVFEFVESAKNTPAKDFLGELAGSVIGGEQGKARCSLSVASAKMVRISPADPATSLRGAAQEEPGAKKTSQRSLPPDRFAKIATDATTVPDIINAIAGLRRRTRSSGFLYKDPDSPASRTLARLWQEVLGIDRVGVADDFFELGGDSVRCVQVVSRARRQGIAFTPEHLFEHTTIERLLQVATLTSGPVSEDPPISASIARAIDARSTVEIPLTPLQSGILFDSLNSTATHIYLEQDVFRIRGPLDGQKFRWAWEKVVQRTPALRATYLWETVNEPVGCVHPDGLFQLQEQDWSGTTEAEWEEPLARYLAAERRRGFDLNKLPLARFGLFRIDDRDHVFAWHHHHIILDGWSVMRVWEDVLRLYRDGEGAVERPDPGVVEPAAKSTATEESFWRERLRGYDGPGQLADQPNPGGSPHAPGAGHERHCRTLAAKESTLVCETARRRHTTASTLFQAAWALLLSRYTSSVDVAYGCNVSGRHVQPGVEDAVGLLINTLPLRTTCDPESVVGDWLQQIQRSIQELQGHAHSDLASIRKWGEVPPGAALFNSIVVFANYPGIAPSALAGTGLSVERCLEYRHSRTGYPVTLTITPVKGTFHIELVADVRLFDRLAADRLLDHYTTLLAGLASSTERKLGAVPILSTAGDERARILTQFSPGPAAAECSLPEWLDRAMRSAPDRCALISGERVLTYAELDAEATALAQVLREKHQVAANRLVGLCLSRSVELVVSVLAVIKAGGAYCPIDPGYPSDRIEFILADSGAGVLLVNGAPPAGITYKGAVVNVGDRSSYRSGGGSLGPPAAADSLIYVIYTSGTTGKPKGSGVYYRGFSNLMSWYVRQLELDRECRTSLLTSFSFDLTQKNLWGPLLAGGTLVLATGGRFDPAATCRLIGERSLTWINCTPSLFYTLLETASSARYRELRSLRWVVLGGEPIQTERLREWMEWMQGRTRVLNSYGPTECSDVVAAYVFDGSQPVGATLPTGRPIPNVILRVLDQSMQMVPIGRAGELCIGGTAVGSGYVGQPELTAERFVGDPYDRSGEGKLYRTGDLVRWMADGTIEYLGRGDDQVKIRGFRIEPGEIESVLVRHPGIREAVVLAAGDTPYDRRLVAYLVVRDTAPTITELRHHITRQLPDYMVPAAFVVVPQMPLSSNGKVDRQRLPKPNWQRQETVGQFSAPESAVEILMAGIWQAVLGMDKVGRNDNFFELGGDSILSIQVVSRSRRQGYVVTPRQLFDHPSLAAFAAVASPMGEGVERTGHSSGQRYPFTPIQCWFAEQALADPAWFNQGFLFELRRPLNIELLERALHLVRAHHDALRMRCANDGFTVSEADTTPVTRLADLSGLTQIERAHRITAETTEAASTLSHRSGPMLRAVYFKSGTESRNLLYLVVHHLGIDGVSWRILLEDLESAYTALENGKEPILPGTDAFGGWAAKLARAGAGIDRFLGREHWISLAQSKAAGLPIEGSGDRTAADIQHVTTRLSRASTELLVTTAPKVHRTQIQDLLLTALAEAIAGWTGRTVVDVFVEGHGREEIFENLDLSHSIGWFTSIYPVRLDVSGGTTPARINATKECLRAVPGRGIGYGVLRYLHREPSLQGDDKTALLFNYLGRFDQVVADSTLLAFADEPTAPWCSPRQRRRYALEVVCWIADGEFRSRWSFTAACFARGTIQRVAGAFDRALDALALHRATAGARRDFAPGDFPLAKLSAVQLRELATRVPDLVDVYPLAPLQRLMLGSAYGKEGRLTDHWSCIFSGSLDPEALKRSWAMLAKRHPILRTTFHTFDKAEAIQAVHEKESIEWQVENWEADSVAEAESRWQSMLEQDAARGFDLARAPLHRYRLVKLARNRWRFLWTTSSLLLDGWSWPILWRELSQWYAGGHMPGPARDEVPYRDYIEWLAERNPAADQAFWRARLSDVTAPNELRAEAVPAGEKMPRAPRHERCFENASLDRLLARARALQVTPASLVMAAWSIVLARLSGDRDVIFGVACSGRPGELKRVEAIVGPCTTNVPMRVRIEGGMTLRTLVQCVFRELTEFNPHQFMPPEEIAACAKLSSSRRLYESIVVVQNFRIDPATRRLAKDVAIESFRGPLHTNLPLMVCFEPDEPARITLVRDPARLPEGRVAIWAEDLVRTLEALSQRPEAAVESVLDELTTPVPLAETLRLTRQSLNYIAPKTEMERAVAAIWQEMFQLPRISVEDNIFELGAHSVFVVRLHRRMCEALKLDFPLVALFQYPTISAVARHLADGSVETGKVETQNRARLQREALLRPRRPAKGKR